MDIGPACYGITCFEQNITRSTISGAKNSSIVNEDARAALEQNWTGNPGSSGVLRDCNNLKLLSGCTDYIPNSFAHQNPCHWGYEGNRTDLRVRFVLSHELRRERRLPKET